MSRMSLTLDVLNAARRCETTWPATLKFRSDGALVAMTHKLSLASLASLGSLLLLAFHHGKGSETIERNSSIQIVGS